MIAVTAYSGKSVALFGLGGSGLSTARALMDGGADVTAWDDNPDSVKRGQSQGIKTGDLREADWSGFSALVLSPGVPLTHPKPHWTVGLAKAAGIDVIGDIDLFCRQRAIEGADMPFVAITGTNGKSTTTALITHILRHAGRDVQMGGNIGTPVLELEPFTKDRVYVVECSSYQIDLAPTLRPSVGILLNLSPDHLDRHGSMENYAAVKARLVAGAQSAIIGTDDRHSAAIAASLEDAITIEVDRDRDSIDLTGADGLRGDHNLQNALAARATCRVLGLSDDEIATGLKSFPGLAHRMQIIARRDHVLFVNDSKATNADATAKALGAFDNIFWIAGGLAKQGGIEPLHPWFDRIRKAYLIGEAAPEFAATLGGSVSFEISATIDMAVAHAAADALASDADEAAVLLAPAAASFDQFKNFEKRGDAFVAAVQDAMNGTMADKETA